MLQAVVLLAQLQIPAPIGYVNDFARVIDPASQRQMQAVIDEVRQRSGGEIVVVTLPDLGGRPSIDVARDIGRQWRVGARGGPGDRARNAGVIVLLKPGQRPGDGRAELAVSTGSGAEGFVTDAYAGRVRDAIGEAAVQSGRYGTGLVAGVWMIAQAYAREFGFQLTGTPPAGVSDGGEGLPAGVWLVAFVALFFVLPALLRGATRGRGFRRPYYRAGPGWLEWMILSSVLSRQRRGGRRSGWSGGGFGGGFGGGGGGFGGFGGGGGFSGGGASGKF